ncbi:hypothetical protein [Brochothrix campestris]|uniref:Uncharacterized protein n=1 Tax=Brochothrix campestris FSL F6-1037 TaxID=1265861 RepID=W7CFA6_9LIST|nr:hypothetical protein [Brochothrix campestris]EUJ38034.1 hypothetical protein BCAMP_09255 [Brochothrix campestris FSL F6-1037]
MICGSYRYYSLNRIVNAQQLQTRSFELNEHVSTPNFNITATKTTACYQGDEDVYRIEVSLKIHKTDPQATSLSVLPFLWLTPHYQGLNQSVTFQTTDGVVINNEYWQQHDDVDGIVTFSLPRERIVGSKQAVSFEVLFK